MRETTALKNILKHLLKHSPFPEEIMDELKCSIEKIISPIETFKDSYRVSITYFNMQTFIKISEKLASPRILAQEYQITFNDAVRSVITCDEETVEKYPEHSI